MNNDKKNQSGLGSNEEASSRSTSENISKKHDSRAEQKEARVKRRAILGAISVAGATGVAKLPSQWKQPVVDNILLPAHAQMSPTVSSSSATSETSEATSETSEATSETTSETSTMTTVTQACQISCTQYDSVYSIGETSGAGTQIIIEYSAGQILECIDSNGNSSESVSWAYSATDYFYTALTDLTTESYSVETYITDGICTVTASTAI